MGLVRKIMCRLGYHRLLQVIQTFGAAQHIGCLDCRRELAIHHGMRTVLPWDSEIAQLYADMGYDVDGATLAWKRGAPPPQQAASAAASKKDRP